MFKASELVNFCKSMLGRPYWYGTCVYPCTQSLLTSKSKQYPSHYTSSRMAKYKKAIADREVCGDCVGMIKGFFWTNGGRGVLEYVHGGPVYKNSYASNGCPDVSADGMLNWIKKQGGKNGPIKSLPDVPGTLLFMSGHVGVYIGGGYAIEARGFNYGWVQTKVGSRAWKSWGMLTILDYDGASPKTDDEPTTGDRILRKGDRGDDVRDLQRDLLALGYALPRFGADGDFGGETLAAVRAFQAAAGLTVDGEVGPKTRTAMAAALRTVPGKIGRVKDGSWNVRSMACTDGKIITVLHGGDEFTVLSQHPVTGWYCISHNGTEGWISNIAVEV